MAAIKSFFKRKAQAPQLFPKVDPAVDGEECLHDCETCTIKLPAKWSIDESDSLYGSVKGWDTHIIVPTGKSDWVRDVADEKSSIMEAVGKHGQSLANGKLMMSASNMTGDEVLLLPTFEYLKATPADMSALLDNYISHIPTNGSPIASFQPKGRPCPHKYLILLCSHKTRDARCGQSAPLLRREFERILRPLGLQRDLTDERPGGVGIYFISHVGGHKYSANVMVYRREDTEATQCFWLARVRPEHCENIVRYTIIQGKLVKPEQLRGGFDRNRGITSW